MKKIFAGLAAEVAYGLACYLMVKASDAWILRNLRRLIGFLAKRKPDDLMAIVLTDLAKIFESPESSAYARRLILEARPEQFKAVVRGAIL